MSFYDFLRVMLLIYALAGLVMAGTPRTSFGGAVVYAVSVAGMILLR